MKMKQNLALILGTLLGGALWLSACTTDPATPYIIEGELTNVDDGVEIVLMQHDGIKGTAIARDTLEGGRFRFEQMVNDTLDRMSLIAMKNHTVANGFPSMGRTIYVQPGAKIKVKGNDKNIYTWQVESKVPNQKAFDEFLIPEYNELQVHNARSTSLLNRYITLRSQKASADRILNIRDQMLIINAREDSLQHIITGKLIELMKERKPSAPWINQLAQMAQSASIHSDYAYRQDVIDLYESLPVEWKQSARGQEIHDWLYPAEKKSEKPTI